MNRFIEEISPKEKVCNKAPNNYKSITKYNSLSAYVKTLGETNKKKQKFIRKLLLENSLSELGNFMKQMASYLVMIALTRNSFPITPRDSTGKILIISRFNKLE